MSMGWRSAMADLPTGTVTFLFTDIEGSRQATTMAPPSTAVPACAMAYGGRTLLSQATYDLVCDHSLPGFGPDHRFGPRGRDDCHTLGGRETGWQPLFTST